MLKKAVSSKRHNELCMYISVLSNLRHKPTKCVISSRSLMEEGGSRAVTVHTLHYIDG
jgi:hypothetical protein